MPQLLSNPPAVATEPAVDRIAYFVAAARPEHLTLEIRKLYKRNILDSLGCAIAGLQGEPFQALPRQVGTPHILRGNPGDYEIKVLRGGKPSRSIKFSVGADGKLDYSLEKSNQFNHDVMIVPVQILGDQDGQWNHDAWKTDAFYGNPLTGFSPAP